MSKLQKVYFKVIDYCYTNDVQLESLKQSILEAYYGDISQIDLVEYIEIIRDSAKTKEAKFLQDLLDYIILDVENEKDITITVK